MRSVILILLLIPFLCPGLDSNQHTLRRRRLKTVRLPISPPGLAFAGTNLQYFSISTHFDLQNLFLLPQ